MANARIVLGVASLFSIAMGLWLLLWENEQSDCHKRLWGECCHRDEWCGRPDPGDMGWAFLIIGLGLQVLKCLLT